MRLDKPFSKSCEEPSQTPLCYWKAYFIGVTACQEYLMNAVVKITRREEWIIIAFFGCYRIKYKWKATRTEWPRCRAIRKRGRERPPLHLYCPEKCRPAGINLHLNYLRWEKLVKLVPKCNLWSSFKALSFCYSKSPHWLLGRAEEAFYSQRLSCWPWYCITDHIYCWKWTNLAEVEVGKVGDLKASTSRPGKSQHILLFNITSCLGASFTTVLS